MLKKFNNTNEFNFLSSSKLKQVEADNVFNIVKFLINIRDNKLYLEKQYKSFAEYLRYEGVKDTRLSYVQLNKYIKSLDKLGEVLFLNFIKKFGIEKTYYFSLINKKELDKIINNQYINYKEEKIPLNSLNLNVLKLFVKENKSNKTLLPQGINVNTEKSSPQADKKTPVIVNKFVDVISTKKDMEKINMITQTNLFKHESTNKDFQDFKKQLESLKTENENLRKSKDNFLRMTRERYDNKAERAAEIWGTLNKIKKVFNDSISPIIFAIKSNVLTESEFSEIKTIIKVLRNWCDSIERELI